MWFTYLKVEGVVLELYNALEITIVFVGSQNKFKMLKTIYKRIII